MVFSWRGLGLRFIEGLYNADAAFRSVALFDLIAVSFGLTVLFGGGAELVRARLDRRRAAAPTRRLDDDDVAARQVWHRPSRAGWRS